ncbi:hypothetical protein ACIHFD_18220 [Nonomuraea sp. NPDC051941]|uniref:hypothetical protein n=1 Tax=Nonomuraea sp. NPDC051941 TaxID=3364373 RepID=UPI0037C995D4
MFGEQRDARWLWVKTGERRQGQELNAATAAKVDQYVAAVEAFAASSIWTTSTSPASSRECMSFKLPHSQMSLPLLDRHPPRPAGAGLSAHRGGD